MDPKYMILRKIEEFYEKLFIYNNLTNIEAEEFENYLKFIFISLKEYFNK